MSKTRVLIIGAGEAGIMLAREVNRSPLKEVVAFLDDDSKKKSQSYNGIPVVGTLIDAPEVIETQYIDEVLIAIPSAAASVISHLVQRILHSHPHVALHKMPAPEKYFDSVPLIPSLHDISVLDLLQRKDLSIDIDQITDIFKDKTVLITGAGGSIGSEILRQLLKFKCKKIIACGRGEHSIYELAKSLDQYIPFMDEPPVIEYNIVNITDINHLNIIFEKNKPDVVVHAAAHKHVPLMEYNEAEALFNNIGGTLNVLKISHKYNIEKFIFISTDKAVRPSNIMGATKRISELLTQYYCDSMNLNTAVVRFGNVLGSRGSVVPLFQEQILKGGPLTVTDRRVTRYFMTIPESSLLVLNAAACSTGGETFVLKMGDPVKIDDLARRLIELNGLIPDEDIEIVYSGLRAGEKLYEELFYNDDSLSTTANDLIMMQKNEDESLSGNDIEKIENFLKNIWNKNPDEIRNWIKEMIPQYEYETNSETKQRIVN